MPEPTAWIVHKLFQYKDPPGSVEYDGVVARSPDAPHPTEAQWARDAYLAATRAQDAAARANREAEEAQHHQMIGLACTQQAHAARAQALKVTRADEMLEILRRCKSVKPDSKMSDTTRLADLRAICDVATAILRGSRVVARPQFLWYNEPPAQYPDTPLWVGWRTRDATSRVPSAVTLAKAAENHNSAQGTSESAVPVVLAQVARCSPVLSRKTSSRVRGTFL